MTIRIEKGKDVFDLNPGLDRLFPKLDSVEMEYVVFVADCNSIYRLKSEQERRYLSLKLCEGLWMTGKPTVKGTRILEKKNKDVENAIVTYNREINNNKRKKISDIIAVFDNYIDSQLKFMKLLGENEEIDEQVKIYNSTAKSMKDETIKSTYEQIKYFEKELSYEYEMPDDIADDTKEKEVVDTNTADNIDMDKI